MPRFSSPIETTADTKSDCNRALMTVAQAAGYLKLSQSSVRKYIRDGDLNAFRIAGLRKVLIPREELAKLLTPV